MCKVLGIILGIVIMERAFAKARRNACCIEGPGTTICSPAVADGGAFAWIESRTGTKTELANNVLRSRRLIRLYLRVRDLVQTISERYYVVACVI